MIVYYSVYYGHGVFVTLSVLLITCYACTIDTCK